MTRLSFVVATLMMAVSCSGQTVDSAAAKTSQAGVNLVFTDPGPWPLGAQLFAIPETSTFTSPLDPTANYFFQHMSQGHRVVTASFTRPGVDHGTAPVKTSTKANAWTSYVTETLNTHGNEEGIGEGISGTLYKAGIGDSAQMYLYSFGYNGAVAGSDQGTNGIDTNNGEASDTYSGVLKEAASQTHLMVDCRTDCGNPGDGRYLINISRPVAKGFATATQPSKGLTPGTFAVTLTSGSVTPSTAWGTLAGNLTTPIGNPAGIGYTSETFNVNVLHGSFAAGDTVCFAGQYHEQSTVANVSGVSGGVQSITVPLRQPQQSGSWIMANGMCGSAIDFDANESGKLRYPFDVIGATSSSTLVYAWFDYSSGTNDAWRAGNVMLGPAATFTLWPMAEVIDVQDESVSPPKINGALTLEPSNPRLAKWTAGDEVEEPHHYAATIAGIFDDTTINTPTPTLWVGQEIRMRGAGVVGNGGDLNTSRYGGFLRLFDNNPPTMYANGGGSGVQSPPAGINLRGYFQTGFVMNNAPQTGHNAILIGCPVTNCADASANYNVFGAVATDHGGGQYLNFTPSTNAMRWLSTAPNATLSLEARVSVTGGIAGSGVSTFSVAGAAGSGARATCANGYKCDSSSGTLILTTGGNTSTGALLTINFATSRVNTPTCPVSITLPGTGLISSAEWVESPKAIKVVADAALKSGTAYTVRYGLCGGN